MQQLSFKSRIKKLSFHRKVVLLGALTLIIGAFLPWYADLDKFGIGDTFLGITGPMYLAGVVILTFSVVSFGIILMDLFEKPVNWLPVRKEHFYLFVAGFSLFMLILTNSVYFHPKFGVNLTDKSMGVGMVMAFCGVGIVTFGALIGLKKHKDKIISGHINHLDEISSTQKRSHVRPAPTVEPTKSAPQVASSMGKVSEDSLDHEINNVSKSVANIQKMERKPSPRQVAPRPVVNQSNQNQNKGNGRGIWDIAKENLQKEKNRVQIPQDKTETINPFRNAAQRSGSIDRRTLPPEEKIDKFQTVEERLKEYHLKNSNQ